MCRKQLLIVMAVATALQCGRCQAMDEVPLWQVWETELVGDLDHDRLPDGSVTVRLISPSGQEHRIEGFWDGGRSWRVRFAPGETGLWRWRSRCATDPGLDDRAGEFTCVAARDGSLMSRGPLKVAADHRHLEHADGTPFLWLGDTAWNGALRADEADWAGYLDLRREQGFTVVQFVTTQWRGLPDAGIYSDADGVLHVDVEAFRRLDRMVQAVNDHGLVAAPVMLWACAEIDPGRTLSEENAIRLCRYMLARWGANNLAWFLAGDGRYEPTADFWRRVGRAVFADRHDRPVTMHPCGSSWVGELFDGEPWFDFLGYQSGHGVPELTSRWITQGPPAQHWRELEMPIINLEPNYENHPAYSSDYRISGHDVRRAAWLSLLASPTAGVTYGTNSIWLWANETEDAPGHSNLKAIAPWREALDTEGIRGMSAIRAILDGVEWWRLRPAPDLLAEQPGEADPREFIAVSATDERDLLVAYLPSGGDVTFASDDLPRRAAWHDPRTGESRRAEATARTFTAPDEHDWVLVLTD